MITGFKNLGIGLLLILLTVAASPVILVLGCIGILAEFWNGNYFGHV